MDDETEFAAAKSLDNYFKANAAWCTTPALQNRITETIFDLLQVVSRNAAFRGADPAAARVGVLELVGQLCPLDWEKISFPLRQAMDGQIASAAQQYEGLKSFVTVLEAQPDEANRAVFDACMTPPDAPPPPPAPPPRRAPKLAQSSTLAQVFEPAKFQPAGSPATSLLSWQSELPGGGLGPQLAALSLAEGGAETKLLLETGEFKRIANDTFLLARTDDPTDYATVPPYLLACMRACAAFNWAADPPLTDAQLDARFGRFTKPLHVCPFSPVFLAPLMYLFDTPNCQIAGHSVAVTFAVDGTPYFATLEAKISQNGPYVTAKLTDSSGNVVMRLDTPRLFEPAGVYLFPLEDAAIALLIH